MTDMILACLPIDVLASITKLLLLPNIRRLLLTGNTDLRQKLAHGGVRELDFTDENAFAFALQSLAPIDPQHQSHLLLKLVSNLTDTSFLRQLTWCDSQLDWSNFVDIDVHMPSLTSLSLRTSSLLAKALPVAENRVMTPNLRAFEALVVDGAFLRLLPPSLTSLKVGSVEGLQEEHLQRFESLEVLQLIENAPPLYFVPRNVTRLRLVYMGTDTLDWTHLPPQLQELSLGATQLSLKASTIAEYFPSSLTALELNLDGFTWDMPCVMALLRSLRSLHTCNEEGWSSWSSEGLAACPPALTSLKIRSIDFLTDNEPAVILPRGLIEFMAPVGSYVPLRSINFPPTLTKLHGVELRPDEFCLLPPSITELFLELDDPDSTLGTSQFKDKLPDTIKDLRVCSTGGEFSLKGWLPTRLEILHVLMEMVLQDLPKEWLHDVPATLIELRLNFDMTYFLESRLSALKDHACLKHLHIKSYLSMSYLSSKCFKLLPRSLQTLYLECSPSMDPSDFQHLPPALKSLDLLPLEMPGHFIHKVRLGLPATVLDFVPRSLRFFNVPIVTQAPDEWIAKQYCNRIVGAKLSSNKFQLDE